MFGGKTNECLIIGKKNVSYRADLLLVDYKQCLGVVKEAVGELHGNLLEKKKAKCAIGLLVGSECSFGT